MVPNSAAGVANAAILEMMDRVWSDNRSPNLDAVIVE
jgi:hypothetical protein